MWNRIPRSLPLWAVAILLLPAVAAAQPAKDDGKLILKVYRVRELVSEPPDFRYEGTFVPSLSEGASRAFWTREKPLVGFGAGMGGGPGGGMFQVTGTEKTGLASVEQRSSNLAPLIRVDDLINFIEELVDPDSWDSTGGKAAIRDMGDTLGVLQTQQNHDLIYALLNSLRRESGSGVSLTVRTEWLSLTPSQLQQLRGGDEKSKGFDHKTLAALPDDARRFASQIVCLSGQTVHLVSGQLERTIQGTTPVVGGGTPAYMPVIHTPHYGSLLQIAPTLSQEGGVMAAIVEVQSTITRRDTPEKQIELAIPNTQGVGVRIDRMNVAAQQFATSARLPLNQPVIVGGMTFPTLKGESAGEQLYLVMEVALSQ